MRVSFSRFFTVAIVWQSSAIVPLFSQMQAAPQWQSCGSRVAVAGMLHISDEMPLAPFDPNADCPRQRGRIPFETPHRLHRPPAPSARLGDHLDDHRLADWHGIEKIDGQVSRHGSETALRKRSADDVVEHRRGPSAVRHVGSGLEVGRAAHRSMRGVTDDRDLAEAETAPPTVPTSAAHYGDRWIRHGSRVRAP